MDNYSFSRDALLVRLATYASFSVAAILVVVKFFAWWTTDSVSLQATFIDSLLDAAASLINMLAVRHAQQPPNQFYRFGYGKAEALAALAQSLFIVGSAGWLATEVYSRILNPQTIQAPEIGIAVMVFAMVITFALIAFQRYVIKRSNSAAIRADSLHYRGDFLINGGVIISLLASGFFTTKWVDPLCASLIIVYIVRTAWHIALDALCMLMDRELSDELRNHIIKLATQHPKVTGIHELRTRSSGLKNFIQLHLNLDGQMTLSQAHAIADEVEGAILKELPKSEVIIHQDPEGVTEPTFHKQII